MRPRQIPVACFVLILLAGNVSAEIRYPGYLPTFPAPGPAVGVGAGGGEGVWLGADASFCCPIDDERSYWSFADVWVGERGAKNRRESSNFKLSLPVGNSIAIATCRDGKFVAKHYFGGTPRRPTAFFPDPNNPTGDPKGSRLWLRKATLHDGRLYIFAHQVIDPGGVFNTLIIRVFNPNASPGDWKYDYLAVGLFPPPQIGAEPKPKPAMVGFGTEVFLDVPKNYLYTYGMTADYSTTYKFFTTFKITALRIPLDRVVNSPAWSDLGRSSEYLSKQPGVWKPGLLDPNDYHDVEIPAFNSYSVRFNPALKAWQVLYAPDRAHQEYRSGNRKYDDPLVNSMFIMTGPSPFGPWSKPTAVLRFPEMDPQRANEPGRPNGPECAAYFAAEQPAFENSDRDIVATYTIGSYTEFRKNDPNPKLDDLKLYNIYSWRAPNPLLAPVEPGRQP